MNEQISNSSFHGVVEDYTGLSIENRYFEVKYFTGSSIRKSHRTPNTRRSLKEIFDSYTVLSFKNLYFELTDFTGS